MNKPMMMTAKERAAAWEDKYAAERKINAELLAALQTVAALSLEDGVVSTGRPLMLAVERAKAVINKAKGES